VTIHLLIQLKVLETKSNDSNICVSLLSTLALNTIRKCKQV